MLIFLLSPVFLNAEMAVKIKPFDDVQSQVADEDAAVAWLSENVNFSNLAHLKSVRADKYGVLFKFEKEGFLDEVGLDWRYSGVFEPDAVGSSRKGGKRVMPVTLRRAKHLLFDDTKGVVAGLLEKWDGRKERGKGMVVEKDETAGEALAVVTLKNGQVMYFEGAGQTVKDFAHCIAMLARVEANDVDTIGTGIDVSIDTGRVISVVEGSPFTKVPLYSEVAKIDGMKIKSEEAANAFKMVAEGAVIEFKIQKSKALGLTGGMLEIRKSGGKK